MIYSEIRVLKNMETGLDFMRNVTIKRAVALLGVLISAGCGGSDSTSSTNDMPHGDSDTPGSSDGGSLAETCDAELATCTNNEPLPSDSDALCPTDAILCDDFENQTELATERWSRGDWFEPMGVQIENEYAAHGTSAVHVKSGSDYGLGGGQTFFTVDPIAVPNQAIYVRAYMLFEDLRLPGWHPTFIHAVGPDYDIDEWWLYKLVSFAALRNDFAITATGPGMDESIIWNEDEAYQEPGDSTPNAEFTLVAKEWFCLEMFFNGASDEIQVWIDGQEISELHATDESWYTDPETWSPNYDGARLTFGINGPAEYTYDVWYDALVIAHERVGCL